MGRTRKIRKTIHPRTAGASSASSRAMTHSTRMGKPHSVILDSDGVNDECLVYMLRDVGGYIKPLYMFISIRDLYIL